VIGAAAMRDKGDRIPMKILYPMHWILILPLVLFSASAAYAHRVTVFAWVEGDRVHTESKFSGGKSVAGGQIIVYDDRSKEKLLEGTTDNQGVFTFTMPRKVQLRIELLAGMGHKNDWIVKEEEFGLSPKGDPVPAGFIPEESAPIQKTPPVSEIESVVEKILDKKLEPVMKLLVQSQQRETTVHDVMAGIGYIFGLVGVGAYFYSRKRNDKSADR